MRHHRPKSTIRCAGRAVLALGLAVICLSGILAIASAQEQLAAVSDRSVSGIGDLKGGLDLHVPEMPFAERPGAGKSILPDRWAWIEGCHRFVEARVLRDADVARQFDNVGRAGRIADEAEIARYQRRRLLADCLVSAAR